MEDHFNHRFFWNLLYFRTTYNMPIPFNIPFLTGKNISLILFFSLLSFSSCETRDEWENDHYLYPEMDMWFNYLCSPELGGRYSGSDGIKKAENYICDIIGRSDSLVCDVFPTPKCEMTNIIFHIEGKNDSLIVIGAHYDAFGYNSKFPLPGADDNLSGVAVLLKAIKTIQLNTIRPYYSIEFCFFDGEEIGRYGSNHYVSVCNRGVKLYINIDTCGRFDCGAGIYYDNTNPYLKDEFESFILNVKDVKMKLAEYNPIGYTTDCEPFEKNQIPFVSIMNDAPSSYLHTYEDNISHISFEKLDNLAKGINLFLRTM